MIRPKDRGIPIFTRPRERPLMRSQFVIIFRHLENIDLSTWIHFIEKWINVDQSGDRRVMPSCRAKLTSHPRPGHPSTMSHSTPATRRIRKGVRRCQSNSDMHSRDMESAAWWRSVTMETKGDCRCSPWINTETVSKPEPPTSIHLLPGRPTSYERLSRLTKPSPSMGMGAYFSLQHFENLDGTTKIDSKSLN